MNTREIVQAVRDVATEQGVTPDLVCGIIAAESSWDPWAFNPEPRYRYLWDFSRGRPFRTPTRDEIISSIPPDDFRAPVGAARDAEWWGQKASWGLMQIMGATAREKGFEGTFLSALCDPETGLTYGVAYLVFQLERYGNDVPKAISAYNAGRAVYTNGGFLNQVYVDRVLGFTQEWKVRLTDETEHEDPGLA